MYTAYPLPPALHERLEAVEEELDAPIRVIARRRGLPVPDWDVAHIGDYSLDRAREAGITILAYYCESSEYSSNTYYCLNGAALRDYIIPTPEAAVPIVYDEGDNGSLVIGDVCERRINDYIGIHRDEFIEYPEAMLDAFVYAVKLSADPEFLTAYRQQREAREREQLEQFIRASHERELTTRRNTIANLEQILVEHKQYVVSTTRQLREHQQMIDALLIVQHNDAADQIVREWDRLKSHPRIESLMFRGQVIEILTTDDLRLHMPNSDESRWLGQFRVSINVSTFAITLNNLSTRRQGLDHPHVTNGQPCLGGHANGFYELLGRGELYVVFELLIQYLETLNIHDDYGRRGAYWFDVADERPLVEEAIAA